MQPVLLVFRAGLACSGSRKSLGRGGAAGTSRPGESATEWRTRAVRDEGHEKDPVLTLVTARAAEEDAWIAAAQALAMASLLVDFSDEWRRTSSIAARRAGQAAAQPLPAGFIGGNDQLDGDW